jgi:hypothetical protein
MTVPVMSELQTHKYSSAVNTEIHGLTFVCLKAGVIKKT